MTELKPAKHNLMIDLETLGTRPGSRILSIGIVPFSDTLAPNFYSRIAISSYASYKFLAPDQATLDWWGLQDSGVRAEAFSGTLHIRTALQEVIEYFDYFPEAKVWGNSAAFDLGLLAEAFKLCGLKTPWSFRDEMCYRTLKNLAPEVKMQKDPNAKSHTAIGDAINQAAHAAEILRKMTWQQN